MTVLYPAIFTETKDEKNTVLVDVPDVQGTTEGYGIKDAVDMARDCIALKLSGVPDSDIPPASAIGDVDASKGEFASEGKSFVSLVDVDLAAYRRKEKSRTVRRNITLPEWLDDMATAAKINVSAVAQCALKERLGVAI